MQDVWFGAYLVSGVMLSNGGTKSLVLLDVTKEMGREANTQWIAEERSSHLLGAWLAKERHLSRSKTMLWSPKE